MKKIINYRLSEIDEQIINLQSALKAEKAAIISRISNIEKFIKAGKYEKVQNICLSHFAKEMEADSQKIEELLQEKKFLESVLNEED